MAKQEKTQKRVDRPKQCAQTSEFKKSWDRLGSHSELFK